MSWEGNIYLGRLSFNRGSVLDGSGKKCHGRNL